MTARCGAARRRFRRRSMFRTAAISSARWRRAASPWALTRSAGSRWLPRSISLIRSWAMLGRLRQSPSQHKVSTGSRWHSPGGTYPRVLSSSSRTVTAPCWHGFRMRRTLPANLYRTARCAPPSPSRKRAAGLRRTTRQACDVSGPRPPSRTSVFMWPSVCPARLRSPKSIGGYGATLPCSVSRRRWRCWLPG